MKTQLANKLIALTATFGLVLSTALLAPAALAHDNESGAQGCHSHEDQNGSGNQYHCH